MRKIVGTFGKEEKHFPEVSLTVSLSTCIFWQLIALSS
jgi:hypothetical protein